MAKTYSKHNHSNCIVENSMLNGLQMNLKDAIEYAGVNVSNNDCLWQYPEIIRTKLIANTINNVNLAGKDIINISQTTNDTELVYNISTLLNTKTLQRPNYSLNNEQWGEQLSVDLIFNDLFNNILPAVKGIHAGDMTVTDNNGNDTKEWNNTLFKVTGNKSGLNSNSNYLRLYLTCQAEPLYILINDNISNTSNGYNMISSDTVSVDINNDTKTITANVLTITEEQIDSL
jgi:hypothetical protein